MTNITLDHLDPTLADRLQQRASANGRTIEAEIAAILESVLILEQPQSEPPGLVTSIERRFADIDDFEIPETPREPIRTPPTF
jgi:plasmid stability protein